MKNIEDYEFDAFFMRSTAVNTNVFVLNVYGIRSSPGGSLSLL